MGSRKGFGNCSCTIVCTFFWHLPHLPFGTFGKVCCNFCCACRALCAALGKERCMGADVLANSSANQKRRAKDHWNIEAAKQKCKKSEPKKMRLLRFPFQTRIPGIVHGRGPWQLLAAPVPNPSHVLGIHLKKESIRKHRETPQSGLKSLESLHLLFQCA